MNLIEFVLQHGDEAASEESLGISVSKDIYKKWGALGKDIREVKEEGVGVLDT